MKELRQFQIKILDYVHEYCSANNLKYSLAGGTMLGAIRHKGYIPWDDDIDIMMPREDYDFLISNITKSIPNLVSYSSMPEGDKPYFKNCGKLAIKNTLLVEPDAPSYIDGIGINIDIFPIDYFSGSKKIASYKSNSFVLFKKIYFSKYIFNERFNSKVSKVAYIIMGKFPGVNLIAKKAINKFFNFNKVKSNFAISTGSVYYKKDIFEKEIYDNYSKYTFCGKQYNGIQDYDTYLGQLYGNYMELPPEEKRVSHNVNAFVR
ncbi:LicD family protein [Vibrio rarus]|uniref:LicD family protein n=1 Tax=Vibrio rarus TaxID=413403 RepID=UPI0021C335AF|nr:LicD family protein [Vibrio rarus]